MSKKRIKIKAIKSLVGEDKSELPNLSLDEKTLCEKENKQTQEFALFDTIETTSDNNQTDVDNSRIKKKANKTLNLKKTRKTKSLIGFYKLIIVLIFSVISFAAIGGLYFMFVFRGIYFENTKNVNDSSFYVNKMAIEIYNNDKNFVTTLTPQYVDWLTLCRPLEKDEKQVNTTYLKEVFSCGEKETLQIPEIYLASVIATEDGDFKNHHGIDIDAMFKGIATNIAGGDRGGSTISMQLAKIIYMNEWYTEYDENGLTKADREKIKYKLLQMSYALKIEGMYTKHQILENYINSVNYGTANGVENASLYNFGHGASTLSLSESSLLAGIPQAPTQLDPYAKYDMNEDNVYDSLERRNEVLGSLLREQFITQEQYDAELKIDYATLLINPDKRNLTDIKPYVGYLDVVLKELQNILSQESTGIESTTNETTGLLNNAGIKVYTNMDETLQKSMYSDLSSSDSPIPWQDKYIQAGAVQMDTQSGAIYAVGNGRGDREMNGVNYAYDYPRQPGSISKPIVSYAPSFEYLNYSTYQQITDKKMNYRDGGGKIQNADGKFYGTRPLQFHVNRSLNTPAIQTFYAVADKVGYEKIGQFMRGLGIQDIPLNEEGKLSPYAAYAIGGWDSGTTPTEMAGAYAAFGNGGIYNEPHAIDYIEFSEYSPYFEKYGKNYKYEFDTHKAMEESTAFMMSKVLDVDLPDASEFSGTAARGGYTTSEHGFNAVKNLSAKTGTSNSVDAFNNIIPNDTWVAGFTPDLTTVVWAGYDIDGKAKGLYPNHMDGDSYELFHLLTWNGDLDESKYLHDNEPRKKPDNVSSQFMGNTEYFFVNGENKAKETLTAPIYSEFSSDGSNLFASWSNEGKKKDVSYDVLVDGKLLKNIKDTSLTITADELASVAGCKITYAVTLQATDGKEKSEVSETREVTYANDAFCK